MKALIKSVEFTKEFDSKFGKLYGFKVIYIDNKEQQTGFYSSKTKEQNKFIKDQECEFDIEFVKTDNGGYNKIKPITQNKGYSNTGRAMQREQTKYSGFAMAYAKDLVVADKIKPEQMFATAQKMIDWMVEQDKALLK